MVNCCKIVKPECVVPENIHTLTPPLSTESNGNSEGRRGAKGGNFRGGGGGF